LTELNKLKGRKNVVLFKNFEKSIEINHKQRKTPMYS